MTLQQLNDVIAIAETGSFNRAAERLYIAQPSLTNAIKELEKELGMILFNRSGKGATLTAEGVNFLPYARSVIMQYRNLLDAYGKAGGRSQRTDPAQSRGLRREDAIEQADGGEGGL